MLMETSKSFTKQFLLQQIKVFTLKQQIDKVLACCPMFNDTLLLMGYRNFRKEFIGLYDCEGQIIKERSCNSSCRQCFVVTSDREVVWVDKKRDQIIQWNLQTDEYVELDYEFNIDKDKVENTDVQYFPQTNLLCIQEYGCYSSSFFKIAYFSYPLTTNSQPIHIFCSYTAWNYEHLVRKANNRSGIVWFKGKTQNQIEFNYYEIQEEQKGKWKGKLLQKQILNPLRSQKEVQFFFTLNIWELTPNNFMYVTLAFPQQNGTYSNALFVLEVNNNIFRQAKFSLNGEYRNQNNQCLNFGNFSMIKGFDFVDGKLLPSPIYYIDNRGEKIIAIDENQTFNYSQFVPSYDGNCIVENKFEFRDVKQVLTKSIKIVIPVTCLAILVEGFYKQIDDDLLKKTLQILGFQF